MIGYVMLGTNDVPRAKAFYDAVLGPLGATPYAPLSADVRAFYSVGADKPMFGVGKPFDGKPANFGNGTMAGLPATSRAVVDAVYNKAMSMGGTDEGKPGVRGAEEHGFYAAYFRDLDGNKLCVFRVGPA